MLIIRRRLHTVVRHGFTLLETIIAVGLMTLLMAGLYSAMTIYYDLRIDSYDEIERAQIARTLLRQITRDVQSVVFQAEQSVTDDSSSDTDEDAEEGGTTTVDPAASMAFYTNGLVGTETDLLLYVSRPDRDLNYISSQDLASFSDRSGDLMIVRYFVAQSGAGGLSSQVADQFSTSGDNDPVGLVRTTGDLYGLSMAIQENKEESQAADTQMQAPEVAAIQFQYFDGSSWQAEWDSTQLNSMPVAIEVILTLVSVEEDPLDETAAAEDIYGLGQTTHRMVINIPVAEPVVPESAL